MIVIMSDVNIRCERLRGVVVRTSYLKALDTRMRSFLEEKVWREVWQKFGIGPKEIVYFCKYRNLM